MKIGQGLVRRLKFHWRKPTPPAHPQNFSTPVVVVGSAPVSTKPEGFDDSYVVITVNGSQAVSAKWGRAKPDVTFMATKQIGGVNTNAVSVRSVIKGSSTGRLFVALWNRSFDELKDALVPLEYGYDELYVLSRMERMALHCSVTGELNLELRADDRFSNGITGVLYALANNAPAVIITGIDPTSSGHTYNDANLRRQHAETDADVLQLLIKNGWPLYTADVSVANAAGIPLWSAPYERG